MNDAQKWAHRLGLAMVSPLFPARMAIPGEHCAMLDGRRASFACSTVEKPDVSAEDSKSWQWSSDLAHHVLIGPKTVFVRSGRETTFRQFHRDSIEGRLEEFLAFLDSAPRSTLPDIVSFLIQEFRGIWAASGYTDGASALVPFLLALYAADQDDPAVLGDKGWCLNTAEEIGIEDWGLPEGGFNRATIERAESMRQRAPLGLQLIPSLVLRHVAGRLFQEAHAIIETTQLDLFGNTKIITSSPTFSPIGAYFTPVPIARLMSDWTLSHQELPNEIIVADYACGSAVFLTEALRTLERLGFNGTVRLVGRDKSAQAIRMAKVAVRTLQRDVQTLQVVEDISQADALEEDWPQTDICLMNPPFRSWERMDERERDWVQELTAGNGHGRPDLSVGFIERALRALRPGGTLTTLLPAGVLASDSLSVWRNALTHRGKPTLVAVLGEHSLFEHALVNVGILSLQTQNPTKTQVAGSLSMAWSSADPGSASQVIRAIRRSISEPVNLKPVSSWTVTTTTIEALQRRPSWLPGAGALGQLLEDIQQAISTRVEDLFEVLQGVRTGAKSLFVQPSEVVKSLPEREQRFFRKAVTTSSFVDGEIKSQDYLFFVPKNTWSNEDEMRGAIPVFFNEYIRPQSDRLRGRKSLRAGETKYWELTRARGWMFKGPSRLVSKRFGLYPAFARDFDVSFAIVQANAWRPTELLTNRHRDTDELGGVLTSYWWLLNSRVMVALMREFCPNVAGGQLDLEHKYVKHVPLPNLSRRFAENPTLPILANSIRSLYQNRLPPVAERDRFAAEAFGTDLSMWNLSGLELPD